jgi:hypothetical protein
MSDEETMVHESVQPRKLWFGFAGSAFSWVTLGCLDIFISWSSCTRQENFGVPETQRSVAVVLGILALTLLAITIAAGFTSYRNWRDLSSKQNILHAEAVERREFMALLGVIISVTLGFGICCLALPPLLLDLCWRAR